MDKLKSRKLWMVVVGQMIWTGLLLGGYLGEDNFTQLTVGCWIGYVLGNGAEHFSKR